MSSVPPTSPLARDKPQRYIFSVEVVGGVSIAVCRRPRFPWIRALALTPTLSQREREKTLCDRGDG